MILIVSILKQNPHLKHLNNIKIDFILKSESLILSQQDHLVYLRALQMIKDLAENTQTMTLLFERMTSTNIHHVLIVCQI